MLRIAMSAMSLLLLWADFSAAQEASQPDQKNLPDYSNQKRLEWFYQTRLGNATRMLSRMKTFSKGAGDFADTALSAKLIPTFLTKNPSIRARADEFANPNGNIEGYPTFNAFFTRALSEKGRQLRPFNPLPQAISSPADSALFVIPELQPDSDFFVKGNKLNLNQFFGCNPGLAKKYEGGTLMLFYLAPEDYHRFHFPFDATIASGPTPITGTLDSVDPIAYTPTVDDSSYSSELFVFPGTAEAQKPFTSKSQPLMSNERKLVILNSKEFGDVAFMAVGAMMVGSVKFIYDTNKSAFKKGDEMGLFAFGGSTVVLLFEKGRAKALKRFIKALPTYPSVYMMYTDGKNPVPDRPKTKVRLGETVGLSLAKTALPKAGFCVNANNAGYYLLKTDDKPSWASGDLCYVKDGTITEFGDAPCIGGTQEQCKAAQMMLP